MIEGKSLGALLTGGIPQNGKVNIFGAMMYGYSVFKALSQLAPLVKVDSFLVSETDGNPDQIEGTPVRTITDYKNRSIPILLAIPDYSQAEVSDTLFRLGYRNVIKIDAQLYFTIMSEYFKQSDPEYRTAQDYLRESSGGAENSIEICMAKANPDKKSKNDFSAFKYITPVVAGAALNAQKSNEKNDFTGDNISRKNRNFCELTVAYWMWKNISADYMGICHYRRAIGLSDGDGKKLKSAGIDVILPTPMLINPSVYFHHRRYVCDTDWQNMMLVLKQNCPEYYNLAHRIFSQQRFYMCNILIAKREVICDFYSWMFSILFETEKLSDPDGKRHDRYIGYLGENLTTLYFMAHKHDLAIAHEKLLLL